MKRIKSILYLIIGIFIPSLSYAQDSQRSGIFESSGEFTSGWIRSVFEGSCTTNDTFFQMLYSIIGNPCFENDVGASDNMNLLQYLLGYFNIAAMIFAAIMIVYLAFRFGFNAAVYADEKDKNRLPLRVAIGFALILPHTSLGYYSVVQVAVLKVIGAGGGSAEYIVDRAGDAIESGVPMQTDVSIPPEIISHNADLMEMMLCSGAMVVQKSDRPFASYINEDGSGGEIMLGESFKKASNARQIGFGSTGTSNRFCGYVEFPQKDTKSIIETDYVADTKELARQSVREAYIDHIDNMQDLASNFFKTGGDFHVGTVNKYITETARDRTTQVINRFNLGVDAYVNHIGLFAKDIDRRMNEVSTSANDATKEYMKKYKDGMTPSNYTLSIYRARSLGSNADALMRSSLPTFSNAELRCGRTEKENTNGWFSSWWGSTSVCDMYEGLNDMRGIAKEVHASAVERAQYGQLPSTGEASIVADLANDPSCKSGDCDAEGLKKSAVYTINKGFLNILEVVGGNSSDGNAFDYKNLADPIQTTQNVGTALVSMGLSVFGLMTAGSALIEGVGGSAAAWVGAAAVSGALKPLIGVLWMIFIFLMGIAPALIIIIPAAIFITYMFAFMSYLMLCIAALLAAPMAAARGIVPEGQGIVGQRGERMIMMIATLFLYPSAMVIGVSAYFVVLPYAFAILSFFISQISQLTSGFTQNTVALVAVFTIWVSTWNRMNLWLANSTVFIGDKALEMLGTFNALSSESDKVDGIVQEMGGASKSFAQGVTKSGASGLSQSIQNGVAKNSRNNSDVGVSGIMRNS